MITKLVLKIIHFPKWLKQIREIYPALYYQVWIFIYAILFSVLHFFSFRNDYVYLAIMLVLPLGLFIYQGILNFTITIAGQHASPDALRTQNFPITIAMILMIINAVMLVFSHQVWGSDAYDEYFFLTFAGVAILILALVAKILRGKWRPIFMIVLYFLTESIIIFIYILSVTAE